MNKLITLLLVLTINTVQSASIKAGPMLGHVALRGANIWIQSSEAGKISLEYWNIGSADKKTSITATLDADFGNVHTFKIAGLEPGTDYQYRFSINGQAVNHDKTYGFTTQTLWQFRTDPPAFSVLTGSCNFENEADYDRKGKPYGAGWEIFDQMAAEQADMMLWLGDNWYYREVDFDAEQNLLHRVIRDKSWDHLQKLFEKLPNYAIWDDHDFGPDNSGGYFEFKQMSLAIFKKFWANPSYGSEETNGIFTKVRFNDVDFFLMDARYHRSNENMPDGPDKHMYGQEQLLWLKNQLAASRANFKFIVGGNQMLNDYHSWEGWDKYRYERDAFIKWLDEAKIEGLFFLSGDKHHTELLKINRENAYPLYELTCSPFTAGTHEQYMDQERTKPTLVKDTLVGTRNYCKLNFSGPRKDRTLNIEVYGPEGQKHWSKNIKNSVLSYWQTKD
ncbi:MAG: alkaline phosphatase D family protein [Proteobacteria bacterium]|nr:alkaline phosphatase D family protein [Pseudomonadota bacterium]